MSSFPWRYHGKNPISYGTLIRPANLGQNLSLSRIICFYTRYSNGNILNFRYWNQEIQKPKFIYISSTATFMKDYNSDKIISRSNSGCNLEDEMGFLLWSGNQKCRASSYGWKSDIKTVGLKTQEICISSL
jgi:hypothetical protein